MNETKNKQLSSLTEDHLEAILEISTSYMTSRYYKRFADDRYNMSCTSESKYRQNNIFLSWEHIFILFQSS